MKQNDEEKKNELNTNSAIIIAFEHTLTQKK